MSDTSTDQQDVQTWKRDLIAAGWHEESVTSWKAPDGSLWRGPYGAWRELKRQQPQPPQPEAPELLPCPFCGSTPETGITGAPECDNWRYVKCSHNYCEIRYSLFTVKRWNRRADLAAERPAENYRACPCLHTEPCHKSCTCVQQFSSRGCSFCCSYGSTEQQAVRAEHLRKLILLGLEVENRPADEDERVKTAREDERRACAEIATEFGTLYYAERQQVTGASEIVHYIAKQDAADEIAKAINRRSESIGE